MGCASSNRHPPASSPLMSVSPGTASATCRTPGCGKQTWNGKPGEKCTKSCGGVKCITPGCGKPTWNGKPGEKCTKSCGGVKCITPGCGKPTWNGQAGERCTKSCGGGGGGGITCITPGCNKPTWNGQAGERCTRSCGGGGVGGITCVTPGCNKPTWNGKAGEKCSRSCGGGGGGGSTPLTHAGPHLAAGTPPQLRALPTSDTKYQEILNQYIKKWKSSKPSTRVKEIYAVDYATGSTWPGRHFAFRNSVGNVATKGSGTNPGNVQRRFHGTGYNCTPSSGPTCADTSCPMCNIIRTGFDMGRVSHSTGDPGVYGQGLYFTSVTSTAKGYGISDPHYQFFKHGDWSSPDAGNVLLVCSVICGVAHMVDKADVVDYPTVKRSKWTGVSLKAGEHSRIIDKPKSDVDECVIFNADQILVTHVIAFR